MNGTLLWVVGQIGCMDELAALERIADLVPNAGDDAAIVGTHLLTSDMLHEETDFPGGTTRYTAGWRSVGASLSDIAAMGGEAVAGVAIYAAPDFDGLQSFVTGASDVCETVGADYVGGDLDTHQEFTVATTVLGRTDNPVRRSGASPGDAICVTGSLGRSAAAVRLFEQGDTKRANELFQFEPRVAAGRVLATSATAMMDISDGLARSLHQLAEASACGMAVDAPLPIDDSVVSLASGDEERRELGVFFGEDFELLCTIPSDQRSAVADDVPGTLSQIGTVTDAGSGVTLDGEPLPDRGYTHG